MDKDEPSSVADGDPPVPGGGHPGYGREPWRLENWT